MPHMKRKKRPVAQEPGDGVDPEQSLYPSLVSLQSEESDEEFSCTVCCKKVCSHLFDFTIASCQYVTCLKGSDGTQDDNSSIVEDMEISEMKDKLLFHFMNPFEKWKYQRKRRFPWKLIVQLINIILVTTQLSLFATTKFALNNFLQENEKTFVQLFVKDPIQVVSRFTPPPDPIATIYSFEQLHDQLNFTAYRYYTLLDLAVGPYGYGWGDYVVNNTLELHVTHYKVGIFDPTQRSYYIKGPVEDRVYIIGDVTNTSLDHYVPFNDIKHNFDGILKLRLHFKLSSVYVSSLRHPYCFLFTLNVDITNDIHSGNMPVSLHVDSQMSECKNTSSKADIPGIASETDDIGYTVLDCVVIIFAIILLYMCFRSLMKSAYFSRAVKAFFIKKFSFKLKYHHMVPLYNLWFVGVILSNILVVIGSIMKIIISYHVTTIEVVDFTSIILGLAVFAQWCCILRFLSYFDKYNMLLLTIRVAMPSVVRFIICAGILYIAFLLCGWLVLGPYHPKFSDPSTASECLFSLVNGDDMFNTYVEMSKVSFPAWIFSKIYLYVFISLFIYVVLSVFIGLIADTYETIREGWSVRSKGLLQDFATNTLGRAARKRTQSQASVGGGEDNEDELELIRDMANTPTYGTTAENQPLLHNGGPMAEGRPRFIITDHSSGGSRTSNVARVSLNDDLPLVHSDSNLQRHRSDHSAQRIRSNSTSNP